MSFKEKLTEELNKVSVMDKQKKWEYYKTYYMWPSIAIVIGLVLFGWFIKDTMFKKEAVSMGCAFVEITDEQKYALTDGYLKYYGYNPKKCSAVVATDNLFADTAQKMDAYENEMALQAQIAAGEIYYLIFDRRYLDYMTDAGIYADLDTLFSDERIKELEYALVDVTDPDSGRRCAVFDMNKLGFFDGNNENYLIFTIAYPDEDYPNRFIDYILSYNEKN